MVVELEFGACRWSSSLPSASSESSLPTATSSLGPDSVGRAVVCAVFDSVVVPTVAGICC
jgi:hypothetical protein